MEVTALEIGSLRDNHRLRLWRRSPAVVDTTGWALGRHLLMVEAQDATVSGVCRRQSPCIFSILTQSRSDSIFRFVR